LKKPVAQEEVSKLGAKTGDGGSKGKRVEEEYTGMIRE
jgi:hypothetical protein